MFVCFFHFLDLFVFYTCVVLLDGLPDLAVIMFTVVHYCTGHKHLIGFCNFIIYFVFHFLDVVNIFTD